MTKKAYDFKMIFPKGHFSTIELFPKLFLEWPAWPLAQPGLGCQVLQKGLLVHR